MKKTKTIEVHCCDKCGVEIDDFKEGTCKICGAEMCENHGEYFTGNYDTEFFLCDDCIEKYHLDI